MSDGRLRTVRRVPGRPPRGRSSCGVLIILVGLVALLVVLALSALASPGGDESPEAALVEAETTPPPRAACPEGCAYGLAIILDKLGALERRIAALEVKPPSTGRLETVLVEGDAQ